MKHFHPDDHSLAYHIENIERTFLYIDIDFKLQYIKQKNEKNN